VPVASGTWHVAFYAEAGTTYEIAVADSSTASGAFWLSLDGPLPPPGLDSTGSVARPDGGFQMRAKGVGGQSFVVQASTNLVDWENIRFDTLQGSSLDLVDVDAPQYPQRFYRVLPLGAVLDAPPLQILSKQPSAGGGVLVHVIGPEGQPLFLQFSTDSQTWSDLTSGVIVDGGFDFVDGNATQSPPRLYRVVSP
jgi:hypothetical protein